VRERENYGANYREAQQIIGGSIAAGVQSRSRAYLLLKQHGQVVCKRTIRKLTCVDRQGGSCRRGPPPDATRQLGYHRGHTISLSIQVSSGTSPRVGRAR
jgi:hypothetical protein